MALASALRSRGAGVVPVVRNPARWPGQEAPSMADIGDQTALTRALADATHIVSTAHARHTAAILAAAPAAARFVFLGSTRQFTRWPDAHAEGVRQGEAALLGSGRPGIMLHPTMIYGAEGEDNVQRLAALLRRLPIVPLPGGGRALVQPIHQSDVTRAILAALSIPLNAPEAVIIAGPAPLRYDDFVHAVATAAGLSAPQIIPAPAWLLRAAVSLARRLPGLPRIDAAEIRRLTEDKNFSIDVMQRRLGVTPIPLDEGLQRTFKPG